MTRTSRTFAALAAGLVMGVLGASPAFAGTTGVLGSTTPISGFSQCGPGGVVIGVATQLDPRGLPKEFQPICLAPDGTVARAPRFGYVGETGPEVVSACPAGGTATGLFGGSGDVVDGFGVICTTGDGAVTGGGGTPARRPCPAGERLVGFDGFFGDYFGGGVLIGLRGRCEGVTDAAQCKSGGFRSYGFKNQGACVSAAVRARPKPVAAKPA
jgi:hypothetical protein